MTLHQETPEEVSSYEKQWILWNMEYKYKVIILILVVQIALQTYRGPIATSSPEGPQNLRTGTERKSSNFWCLPHIKVKRCLKEKLIPTVQENP